MKSEGESFNLKGITVNDVPIQQHLINNQTDEKTKEVQAVYKDEIRDKKNIISKSSRRKTHHKPKTERPGKMVNFTPQQHYNRREVNNFQQCKTLKQIILSILLSGKDMTSNELFAYIQTEAKNNINLNEITKKIKEFSINQIWTAMNIIKRSDLNQYLIVYKKQVKPKKGKEYSYKLDGNGQDLTLDKAVDMSKDNKRPGRRKISLSDTSSSQINTDNIDPSKLSDIINKLCAEHKLKVEVSGNISITFKAE